MAKTSTKSNRQGKSAAEHVRRRVLRSKNRFWRPEDFTADSHNAVLHELGRLAQAGKLIHIRRGTYWRGEQTLLGMAPPTTAQLVHELVGETAVGPASWTAALALGLTTQHPARDYIAVPKRPPSSLPETVQLKDRSARAGRAKEHLNWWEVALLEVLADPRVVELDQAAAVDQLVSWLRSSSVRVGRLARATRGEAALVREGMRGLFSAAGLALEAELVPPAQDERVRERALVTAS